MIDVLWLVLALTLAPIIVSIAATAIFIRYPDNPLSVILFSVGLTLLVSLFDILTDRPILTSQGFKDMTGNIFQASSAMLGILGAFLVYHINSISNNLWQVRKDLMEISPKTDMYDIFAPDSEFQEEAKQYVTLPGRPSERQKAIEYHYRTAIRLISELEAVKAITANQFTILFMVLLLSMPLILYSDSLDVTKIHIKLIAYFTLTFSAAAFTSAIYGVYRIIYPETQ